MIATATTRPEPCTLLAATDLMTSATSLLEAVYMATDALGDRDQAGAIQQVLDVANSRLFNAIAIVEAIRKSERS